MTYLILLSFIPILFMTSLIRTAKHNVAGLSVFVMVTVFVCVWGGGGREVACLCVFNCEKSLPSEVREITYLV